MADQQNYIKDHPIGKGLDDFHTMFNSICDKAGICTLDALERLGREGKQTNMQDLILTLILKLRLLPVARLLPSGSGHGILRTDLIRLNSAVNSDTFDFDSIKPLLCSILERDSDERIWEHIYCLIADIPQPIATFLEQTPWIYTTSGIMNSSEKREEVDRILKLELGPLYVDVPSFSETYFGQVAGLEAGSKAVFKKCVEGSNPLFGSQGWRGWPAVTSEKNVVCWFHNLFPKLEAFAKDYSAALASTPATAPTPRRKLLAQPNTPLPGSAGKRSMDIGFVKDDLIAAAAGDFRYRWSHVLVPGELKMGPSDDIPSIAWISIATYAREVLSACNTRRFVLCFTLCGSLMRLWEFDRLGGIASKQFDINKDGLQFVHTMLGFLWMSSEELGFDPTFKRMPSGQQFIEISRNGASERLMIDGAMIRQHCIAGRATTCWRAYPEDDPQIRLVIKDSWQFPERDVEGDLLRKATDNKVINVARYYHHETVQVGGIDDDIQSSVRRGLDITKASNYKPDWLDIGLRAGVTSVSQRGRSSNVAGIEPCSSQPPGSPLPPRRQSAGSKRLEASITTLLNREHRRTIVRDYGQPIYKASSRASLLAGLEGCLAGHESLYRAGLLHRDISINNLIINEDPSNLSWQSFLIDLDLAIEIKRDSASGAKSITGTRAFMAVGALMGEQHSFMHDIESFFWVLFWICIHYEGPGKERTVPEFDKWNYMDTNTLLKVKIGEVNSSIFAQTAAQNFTDYYRPLIPLANRLREAIFPGGDRWKYEDPGLYAKVRKVLAEGCTDPDIKSQGVTSSPLPATLAGHTASPTTP
ncbi:hypothetical protein M406DRAFT_250425 [Cryphonectria parasitica EP155]|uniref:non-specific serine/threonine protein kinase n=1 Tax=Cryphonectria parasitica (strain ATCC 38755 / EP155) TaxID=660469 RepID=A0A9P4Y8K8_CRYP1|nr:uncharacterized protein M406DRAFT_250425 [Cryphonectria parasitica EP155]KAF3768445.1 hypothetical protein M406DRAFT_250425 [Cryphonectria parasitica EP155]